MTWWLANWGQIVELTVAHLVLSLPAVALSLVIAVPIGRFAFVRPRVGGTLLAAASLAYAIPALPLLIIVPAVLGVPLRSWQTMVTALTIYGTALLVRTAADAFVAVDAEARTAAVALGYSRRQMFWRVDLPLAVPVLISGLRVVVVSTVSLVTIGALIGVPSLGSLLTDGFQRGISGEVWAGVIATVILALALDLTVVLMGRLLTPWARAAARPQKQTGSLASSGSGRI